MDDHFIIGDVHGKLPALTELLIKADLLDMCWMCFETGDVSDGTGAAEFCPLCKGSGLIRSRSDVTVVQVGDLGHFGEAKTADSMTFNLADDWLDVVLWGNHERPVWSGPPFGGYRPPLPDTHQVMKRWVKEDKLMMAYSAHGFLITHAGMPGWFQTVRTGSLDKSDPEKVANWINRKCGHWDKVALMSTAEWDVIVPEPWPLRDQVGRCRGGYHEEGGFLWRDSRESLWPKFRQIFGHTSHELVIAIPSDVGDSYDIDVSKHPGNSVAGMWLPSEETIRVDVSGGPVPAEPETPEPPVPYIPGEWLQ